MRRFPVVDAIKIVSAHLIFFHHLCAYGPIPETLAIAWPDLIDFFYQSVRMAVQPLLVVAGFLAAKSLSRKSLESPLALIGLRYLRLMPAFVIALIGITTVVWMLRPVIDAEWLPEEPSVLQAITHLLLVQEWFDVPALSIGVWYVAMDFQLFASFVLIAHALHRRGKLAESRRLVVMVAIGCVSSMAWFNHFPELDSLALYFFGAYGLGVLAAWAREDYFAKHTLGWVMVAAVLAYFDLPRDRLVLAISTASLLFFGAGWRLQSDRLTSFLKRMGDSAYALFLVHFGMIVVGAALWVELELDQSHQALTLASVLWISSVVLGDAFHRWVELPLQHRVSSRWARYSLTAPVMPDT
jgi:peptidoglycan/LPS O-acetylase OafA/YrhL